MLKKILSFFTTSCILILFVSCTGSENTPVIQTTAGVQSGMESSRTNETAGKVTESAETQTGGRIVSVEIPAPSLANNKIEEPLTREIIVYLPESYENSDKRYPVVYYLCGWSEQCEKYGAELQADMKELVEKGKAKEMIVVVLDGRNKFYGSFYVNSPVTGNWEDYVVKDVVGYIDLNYRTINDANARGISGASMGGFGSLNIAMHHPDIFSCVYSMSPGIFGRDAIVGTSSFELSLALMNEYKEMSVEEAHKAYMKTIEASGKETLHDIGFNSAFVPDPESKAPYIKNITGDAASDEEILELLGNGIGGWDEKVVKYSDNLKKLKAINIEYGKYDEYTWIPIGCEHFSDLLKNEGIDHSLSFYVGTHTNKVSLRIKELLLPFFSQRLKFE